MFDWPLTSNTRSGTLAGMGRTNVRWGRVAALAVALTLSVSALTAATAAAGAGPGQSQPANSRSYVVRPGDTLWLIASRLAGPHGDPRPVVDRLIAANRVRDGVIVPGQRLTLP